MLMTLWSECASGVPECSVLCRGKPASLRAALQGTKLPSMSVGSYQDQHPSAVPGQPSLVSESLIWAEICFPADSSPFYSAAAEKIGSLGAVPAETGNWVDGGEMVINAQ